MCRRGSALLAVQPTDPHHAECPGWARAFLTASRSCRVLGAAASERRGLNVPDIIPTPYARGSLPSSNSGRQATGWCTAH